MTVMKGELIMKYNYFEVPTQVKFWDGRYIGGIAYRDEIICGCCGGIFRISDIYEVARIRLRRTLLLSMIG